MPISPALLARLNNPSLLPAAGLIGGKWVGAATDGATFDVVNPSTGEHLATLPDLGVPEATTQRPSAWETQVVLRPAVVLPATAWLGCKTHYSPSR